LELEFTDTNAETWHELSPFTASFMVFERDIFYRITFLSFIC